MSTDEQPVGQNEAVAPPAVETAPVENMEQKAAEPKQEKQQEKQHESAGERGKRDFSKENESDRKDDSVKAAQTPTDASTQKEPTRDNQERSSKGGRRRRNRGSGSESNASAKSSSAHDPDQVAKYAWKIYLAEITEEGVNMVDERTAKELARRCFELAAIFLDEQERQG